MYFHSANGFNYKGIKSSSTNASVPIWFSKDGGNDSIGVPVYSNTLTFNPDTATITISNGTNSSTLNASTFSGTAAQAEVAKKVDWFNIDNRPTLTIAGLALGLQEDSTYTESGKTYVKYEITSSALRSALGLSSALRFIGIIQTKDGTSTGEPDLPAGYEP